MPFVLLFILVSLFEIYLFIQIGGAIGAIPTILVVVLTAIIGVSMLRAEGIRTIALCHNTIARGNLLAFDLLESLILLVGGALLLTPGFFTDAVGFFCLLRTSRMWVVRKTRRHRPDIIEGQFRRHDVDD